MDILDLIGHIDQSCKKIGIDYEYTEHYNKSQLRIGKNIMTVERTDGESNLIENRQMIFQLFLQNCIESYIKPVEINDNI